MAKIEIKKLEDFPQSKFEVTVHGKRVTQHEVTVTREYYEKLTAGAVSTEYVHSVRVRSDGDFELLS